MRFESFDPTPETIPETADTKLGSFQNPSFTEMLEHNVLPKTRYTTDKAEAEAAAQADRSNPFALPDTVVYVEPKGDADGDAAAHKSAAPLEGFTFQNPSFGIDVRTFTPETGEATGEYTGPSPDIINLQMEEDVKRLTFAQEQLAEAIERGSGVMTAMHNVESAQKVLDARMKLYNEAIRFRAPGAPAVAAKAGTEESGEAMLGSVSHAQWELEQAYKNDNKIAIENAKRDLAHEKAKEAAKK